MPSDVEINGKNPKGSKRVIRKPTRYKETEGTDEIDEQEKSEVMVNISLFKIEEIYGKIITEKDEVIKELREKISLLNDKISYLEKHERESKSTVNATTVTARITNIKTYANVLKSSASSIIIKPKNEEQESAHTVEEIGRRINPAEVKVKVRGIQETNKGGTKVNCQSDEDGEKLLKEAQLKLGEKYMVNKINVIQRNPRIKIVGLNNEMSSDELLRCIQNQNEVLKENGSFKLIIVKKMKIRYMAIIETDTDTFKNIIDKGFLCIQFELCAVFEHVDIKRCYKCSGFYHTTERCTKTITVCLKCGEKSHEAMNCDKSTQVCPNCIEAIEKYKLDLSYHHSPYDYKTCEVLK